MNIIDISTISPTNPPYYVYVCDLMGNQCDLIAIFPGSIPPNQTLQLPNKFDGTPGVTIQIINGLGCLIEEKFYCGI